VKALPPPSGAREDLKEPAVVSSLKNEDGGAVDQRQEAVGVRTSMHLTPSSKPLETKPLSSTSPEVPNDDLSLTKIYRVGPNDVLDVRLSESESTKSTLFTVMPSGFIEYPILNEPLPVAGLTVDEIATKIEGELSKSGLVENPKVMIGVRDYASHSILVSGLVKESGTRFLRREGIPLYVVVADSQPEPEAARVTIVRNEQRQIYEIDLTQAADVNLLVRQGDVITFLPNVTQFIYIAGEVKNPGEKTFRRGLRLTQAIISAGGANPKSRVAQLSRADGRGFLVETRLDLKDIGSGGVVDPLLKPGDRIMILR
jgi:protein involved in polysaccharide export with SLBB domain